MVIPKHQISTIKLDTRPKMPECTDHIYTLILYSISPGSRMPKCRENSPYLGTEEVPTPTPKCPQPPSQVENGKAASVRRCARPGDARSATIVLDTYLYVPFPACFPSYSLFILVVNLFKPFYGICVYMVLLLNLMK